jgi:glycosyltransferase involved in cell wall biosynthesis
LYILYVTCGYPSQKYKTHGIFEFDQAKALAQAGLKVIYASIDVRSFRRYRKWGFESFEKDGVQIEAINIPCGALPEEIVDNIRILALRKLYKKIVCKYGQPNLVHAHFINFGYIAAQLFEDKNVPLILTEHYSGMNQNVLSDYLTKIGNYTYRRMDKVIAVSGYLANNINEKFGVQPIVIPNIVDTESFSYNHSKKCHDDFYFISVGSLTKNKRMDLLIKAFHQAFGNCNNVKLFIYGEGPEQKKLEDIIRSFDLTNRVLLMGLAERKAIANKMTECDCFVLASELETFGVAYIEALAMGLPVIATKCGGPEDFVTNENGMLINVKGDNDISVLVSALNNIRNNISIYNRKSISELTKKRFGSLIIANELKQVYSNFLNTSWRN